MPERFDPAPRWAKRVLWVLALLAYALMALLALIVITWPSEGLGPAELAFGRVGGILSLVAAAVCLASYPWHRWRWEMHATWALGIGLTFVTGAVAAVDLGSSRGMLVTALLVAVVAVYTRAVSLVTFGLQTTGAALRARRMRLGWPRPRTGG